MSSQSTDSSSEQHIVALALDDKMVYAFFVLVHSLASEATKPFSLVVGHFTGRLAPRHQTLVRDFAEHLGIPLDLRELKPNPLFTERRHLTITTFSKFVISDEINGYHLWIDLDTVALKGWDEFFHLLFASPASASLVVAEKLQSPHTRFEGFNAGILGWTKNPREDWVPALMSLPEKRFSSEQFLFNTLYADSAHAIDAKFNFLSSWHQLTSELERAVIIHYSGPIKPWHLATRHRKAWASINKSWSYWFSAESRLLNGLKDSVFEKPINRLRRRALFSGRIHTGKGALASWLMRFLALAGPLGDPMVWLMNRRARA